MSWCFLGDGDVDRNGVVASGHLVVVGWLWNWCVYSPWRGCWLWCDGLHQHGWCWRCWCQIIFGLATEFPEANAYGKGADGYPDHGNWQGECPMRIRILELVQLVQENGGIKFAVVPGPEPLNSLVDCLFVPVVEQICDFSGPVHSRDFDLNNFGFIGRDDMIHGAHVASWFDLYGVPRLDLHLGGLVGSWADLIGADCSHWIHGPSVFWEFEYLLAGFSNFELAVSLDWLWVGHVKCA